LGESSGLNDAYRRRHRWGSDRVIIPLKPGNAGGGKDPDFWCAVDDGEVRVIGDEPRNTRAEQDPSEKAVSRSQGEAGPRMTLVFPRPPYARDETSRKAGCEKSARPV
jgi:hypothetical protein